MLVSAQNIHKSFRTNEGPVDVLRGVSLSLAATEMVALTGESGSGKSTLLYLIAGLDAIDQGELSVAGQNLTGLSDRERAELRRQKVGLIFQQFNLIPSLTVQQNLRFYARLAKREEPEWTDHLVDQLGLREQLTRYPEQLSGGQQQRVAIGRTLAARPELILADEPTGNLDEETGDKVVDLMVELVGQSGAGLLVVTHSIRLANRMQRQVHLRAGQLA